MNRFPKSKRQRKLCQLRRQILRKDLIVGGRINPTVVAYLRKLDRYGYRLPDFQLTPLAVAHDGPLDTRSSQNAPLLQSAQG